MANASFVNIDLDESQLKEVEEEAEDKNKDQEEGDKNDESSKKQETSSKNITTTVDPAKLAVKSAQLDRLGKQLVEDYSKYYRLNSGSQVISGTKTHLLIASKTPKFLSVLDRRTK